MACWTANEQKRSPGADLFEEKKKRNAELQRLYGLGMCILHWWSEYLMVFKNGFIVLFTLCALLISLNHHPRLSLHRSQYIYFDSKLKWTILLEMLWPWSNSSVVESLFAGTLSVVTFHIKWRNRPSQSGFRSFNMFTHTWASISHFIYKSWSWKAGEALASGFTINVLRGYDA